MGYLQALGDTLSKKHNYSGIQCWGGRVIACK